MYVQSQMKFSLLLILQISKITFCLAFNFLTLSSIIHILKLVKLMQRWEKLSLNFCIYVFLVMFWYWSQPSLTFLSKRKSKLQLAPIEVCTCPLQLSPVKPDLAQFFFSVRDVWEGILFVIISFFICSVFYLLQLNS